MARPAIRRLTEGDLPAAIALTDLEDWGYSRADFRRLLYLSPRGCFVAEMRGRVVGILTTTSYGRLAYLGAVIVRPQLRGQGIGRSMIDAALDFLESSGVESVRLYAYLNQVRFYAAAGFRPEYRIVRWSGAAARSPPAQGVRPMRIEDLERVVRFDESYFGANRGRLLARLLDESRGTFLLAEDGDRLTGYAVGMRTGASCEIGPWVVSPSSRKTAAGLFASLTHESRSESYAFSGPAVNVRAGRFAKRHGFHVAFRTLRMVRGRRTGGGNPGGVWGVGGLEKG